MEQLSNIFKKYFGIEAETILKIGGSGSNRQYYRLCGGGKCAVGVVGVDLRENEAFYAIGAVLREAGVKVPEIYGISSDRLCYLQEDLGDTCLLDVKEDKDLVCRAMAQLPKIQFAAAKSLDFSQCYPQTEFSQRTVRFDLNYFKYCFLKPSGLEFNEMALEDEYEKFMGMLSEIPNTCFMYRDFQARNVMVHDGEPYFIDFQGGMRGKPAYDVVSFVYQAKAAYSAQFRRQLLEIYYENLLTFVQVPQAEFDRQIELMSIFRTMQVLGAYGFRGKIEGKRHFLESIPPAIENLRGFTREYAGLREEFPYLFSLFDSLCEKYASSCGEVGQEGALTVEVMSFSYRKGIPQDASSNGGGYVFDCRALHNPGRYEQYKQSTGLDSNVIEFLEGVGEVQAWLDNVYSLVDGHVGKFLERGFTHLQACFGCTGGQHRSVYCAQHLADHLAQTFAGQIADGKLRIVVNHRERGVRTEILRRHAE